MKDTAFHATAPTQRNHIRMRTMAAFLTCITSALSTATVSFVTSALYVTSNITTDIAVSLQTALRKYGKCNAGPEQPFFHITADMYSMPWCL